VTHPENISVNHILTLGQNLMKKMKLPYSAASLHKTVKRTKDIKQVQILGQAISSPNSQEHEII
jgi:hypothetical protein